MHKTVGRKENEGGKRKKNLTIWHNAPCFNLWLFTILVSIILRLRGRKRKAPWYGFYLLIQELCSRLCFNTEHMPRKFFVSCPWSFGDSEKDFMISKISGWQEKRVRECKWGKKIFLPIMLPNHALMGWKFQGTLKSSVSFTLKHILMYFTHLIQVA